jgi:NADPH-dependent 2,4-dienoyl-CoA reductase/sulfur reductase-like enzyme
LGVTVTKVDVHNRELVLSDGGLLSFGSLVAATGVTPRTLPGSDGVAGVAAVARGLGTRSSRSVPPSAPRWGGCGLRAANWAR